MKNLIHCGIITIHNVANYGATFQALGLFQYLRNQNVDAEFIDYSMNRNIQQNVVRRKFMSRILLLLKKLFNYRYYLNSRKKTEAFKKFWNQYFEISTNHYLGDDEFLKASLNYDIAIVGSDQLFNLSLTNNSETYFLPNYRNYKISYSTSFGMNGLSIKNEEKVVNFLKGFNRLSIREESVAAFLKAKYGFEIQVSVDPVYLLTREEWKCFETPVKLPDKYVFCYLMSDNPNIKQVIKWIKEKEKNIQIVIVQTCKQKLSIEGHNFSDSGPAEFLTLLANASYVVTNSFHGCALGIIYKKKIFSLEEERFIGDQRYIAMLGRAEVYDKIVPYNTDWGVFDFKKHVIDGETVYEKLKFWIQTSKTYINESIQLCQK